MTRDVLFGLILCCVILYVMLYRRQQLGRPLLLAAGVALVWTSLAHEQYGYNAPITTVFSINLYALFAWTLGLIASFQLYRLLNRRITPSNWWQKLLLYNSFYLPLLLLAETVAYHVFGVVNVATAAYRGLPLCDCLHAPLWMQLAYFMMGTVYISLVFITNRYHFTKYITDRYRLAK